MAYASFGPVFSLEAGADFSDAQYHAVTIDANGNLVLAGAGAQIVGVLTDDVAQGEHATYQYMHIARVVAGATVAAGDVVASDATGRAVPAGVGDAAFGVAVEGGDADAIISVQLSVTAMAPTA